MPRTDYANCKNCGRHRSEVGLMSRHRLCTECSTLLLVDNVQQMLARSGPNWTKWRRGMVGCVAPWLLDELPPAT